MTEIRIFWQIGSLTIKCKHYTIWKHYCTLAQPMGKIAMENLQSIVYANNNNVLG